ncbi:MAG: hypothetical protein AAGG69_06630 [Pseudomonadota bacterium]
MSRFSSAFLPASAISLSILVSNGAFAETISLEAGARYAWYNLPTVDVSQSLQRDTGQNFASGFNAMDDMQAGQEYFVRLFAPPIMLGGRNVRVSIEGNYGVFETSPWGQACEGLAGAQTCQEIPMDEAAGHVAPASTDLDVPAGLFDGLGTPVTLIPEDLIQNAPLTNEMVAIGLERQFSVRGANSEVYVSSEWGWFDFTGKISYLSATDTVSGMGGWVGISAFDTATDTVIYSYAAETQFFDASFGIQARFDVTPTTQLSVTGRAGASYGLAKLSSDYVWDHSWAMGSDRVHTQEDVEARKLGGLVSVGASATNSLGRFSITAFGDFEHRTGVPILDFTGDSMDEAAVQTGTMTSYKAGLSLKMSF